MMPHPVASGRSPGAASQRQAAPAKAEKEPAKPAPPKPRIAVFRLAGDVTEPPPDETFSFGAIGGHLAPRPARADEEGRRGPGRQGRGHPARRGLDRRGQVEELRQAMAKVRAAGKEIYAHADSLSMREYVLLSGASRLSVVPTADLWVTGLYGESPYLRGLLDKIGVKPDFLTCGAYKSAAEIFLRDGPEPRGRGDAELAARQPLRDLDRADRPRPQGRGGARSASGSTAAPTRPRRPRPPG